MARIIEEPQHVKDAEAVLDSLRLPPDDILKQATARETVQEWQEEPLKGSEPAITFEDFRKQVRIVVDTPLPMSDEQHNLISEKIHELLNLL